MRLEVKARPAHTATRVSYVRSWFGGDFFHPPGCHKYDTLAAARHPVGDAVTSHEEVGGPFLLGKKVREKTRQLATLMADALAAVSSTLARFRAGIAEETSPIQLWPHHFDLSMLWLPGTKIPGQDPDDEEHSDKQMNFGFSFGDDGIPEPYFYVTAYPLPDNFPDLALPPGAHWKSEGFSGAVVGYHDLSATADPEDYLLRLWDVLLAAGRERMLSGSN